MSKRVVPWILLLAAALAAGCPWGRGPQSDADDEAGSLRVERVQTAGTEARYEVRVAEAAAPIRSFGLEVRYDTAALRYSGNWEAGALTQAFTQVGVNEVSPGVLRVGGFTVGEAIPARAKGAVAAVSFEALKDAPPRLEFANPVDDIAACATAAEGPAPAS